MVCKTSYSLNLRRIKHGANEWKFAWILQEKVEMPNAGDFGESATSYAQYNIGYLLITEVSHYPTNDEFASSMQRPIIDTELEGVSKIAGVEYSEAEASALIINSKREAKEEYCMQKASSDILLGIIIGAIAMLAFIAMQ